jgi:hypothetical protein
LKLILAKFSDDALNESGAEFFGFALGPVFNSGSPVYFIIVLPYLQKNIFEESGLY